jgi:hypothetical protein
MVFRLGLRLGLMVSGLGFTGCDEVLGWRWVDPAVTGVALSAQAPIEGDPYLEVGFYVEQLYAPLSDGDACWVVHGLQGGTWTMPALRATGVGSVVQVRCMLTTQGGEQVGTVATKTKLFLANDGFLENHAFPIAVSHTAPREQDAIADLYGQTADLECTVTDAAGRSATATVEVLLAEG